MTAKKMTYPHCRNSKSHETRWNGKKLPNVYDNVNRKRVRMIFIAIRGYLGKSEELVKKVMREEHGNLLGRTALENCGFELACTISRCLLRPSARDMGWVKAGSAIEITGGSRGDCIQAHIETHPHDVSELLANRLSAFHRRHHLPRCDVHSKEKGKRGLQGFGNGVVVAHKRGGGGGWDGDGGTGWQGWGVRHILTQLTGLNDRCENLLVPSDDSR